MTVDFAEIEGWVRAEFAAARQSGVVDIQEVIAHPTRDLVACTLSSRADAEADITKQVAVVDVTSRRCQIVEVGPASSNAPTWSPDGERLALLATGDGGAPSAWVVELSDGDASSAQVAHRLQDVAGAVESIAWSPDGSRLCLVVAQFGAEVSDVHGSGTVAGPANKESWRPVVSPADDAGRRMLHVWELATKTVEVICPAANVWEAGWYGPDRLIALVTDAAGEGAWYGAAVQAIGIDGRAEQLHRSEVQMAQPRANPAGDRWSVLCSRASDRGLLAGNLIVGSETSPGRLYDTPDVDVSAHYWLDDRRVGFAGLRGLATVFGVLDVAAETVDELFSTDGASGRYQPEVGAHCPGGALVTVLERSDLPPTLTAVMSGAKQDLLSTAGPGTAHVVARAGRTTHCTWTSADGLEIDGLLTVPDSDGPHALVVNVHGGPVAAWRDEWIGRDPYAAVLVARGFAVLRPNPRGSTGRGQAFIEAVVRDMGGADVDDIVSGVRAMVDRGITEPGRVGITGNSYGGYMAAWIPCWSDVFAASVSRSPVTDWRSQHLTGNLAEFDEIFVSGDPFDPESAYVTRSPLIHHRRIKTPMMFTAGAHDLATPASQAQQLHTALQEAGVPTQLAIYPEEGHGVRKPDAIADQLARMIAWFETYL